MEVKTLLQNVASLDCARVYSEQAKSIFPLKSSSSLEDTWRSVTPKNLRGKPPLCETDLVWDGGSSSSLSCFFLP